MSSNVTEIAEYEFQLEQVLSALAEDPDNEELNNLKIEIQDLIKLTESQAGSVTTIHGPAKDEKPSDEKKRKFEAAPIRHVGDQVLAKWITGDHQFYSAKITSITGNQADPVYTVKFIEYNEVQTLRSHQVRDQADHKKRQSELPKKVSHVAPPPPPPSTGSTHSTPTSTTTRASAHTTAKAKNSSKEDLSKSASNWSSFAKAGPKTKKTVGKRKAIGESSMFRTEDNGRVGVIGSGRAMTADPGKRGKHVFQPDRD